MGTIDYNGLSNSYTYMGWQLITDPTSQQYKLREDAGMNFDSEGFGIIYNRYVIACTEYYGNVGDYIDWTLANGSILHTIIGDVKSSSDPNYNQYGHIIGNSLNVVEFVVDQTTWYTNPMHDNPGTANCHPEWAGLIQQFDNNGNYWMGDTFNATETFYLVKGTRYGMGGTWQANYLASLQGNNWLYFNDDLFWRIKPDGSLLQVFNLNTQIWVNSNAIINLSILPLKIASSGSGLATNAQVERAVIWMVDKVNLEYIVYSRDYRNLKNPNGSSYDCSSFVITGFYMGGLNADATTTSDMKQAFIDLGFTWIPGSRFESSDCLRGDILLKEFEPGGHTQVYIGDGQDVNCGDTPACVQEHAPDNYGRGWDGLLRLV